MGSAFQKLQPTLRKAHYAAVAQRPGGTIAEAIRRWW